MNWFLFNYHVCFLIGILPKINCSPLVINTDEEGSLIAVVAFFRHGARSPEKSFPTDEYFNKTYWPMGYGQLTKYGIACQYRLGQWFRQRYQNFLSEIYSPKDIYAYSTAKDRTIASASAALAGLYPPKGFQLWNQHIPWQPIPVHSNDISKDDMFVTERPCNKFQKIFNSIKKKTYAALEKQYANILEYASRHTGWETMTLYQLKVMRSNLYTYGNYNRSFIPKWSNNLDWKILDYLAAVVFELPSNTTELARLQTGPFFDYIIKYFDSFTKPSLNINPKFLMIAGHDVGMVSVLDAMGVFQMKPVNFGDTTLWELRKRNDGSYFLNVLYKRGSNLDMLNVKDCGLNCGYDEFKRKMSNITVTIKQWLRECGEY